MTDLMDRPELRVHSPSPKETGRCVYSLRQIGGAVYVGCSYMGLQRWCFLQRIC